MVKFRNIRQVFRIGTATAPRINGRNSQSVCDIRLRMHILLFLTSSSINIYW